ncbi:GDSL-type esterase/lipase family protein [Solirubrobacter phytolaccae]|uniref:GDSL-type esterase/lipase family protein n=1 Tax=Solirubrobacter phytolaccae TaxID=1404360 RepID=A0A9X3N5I5_9ACTN|nr:GDSL-type esterase/lipase family protein [Solirubrobacter phytolaccae]MDA0180073.1 GDSL-type esterase/lipase family protein [Solirubrobacter phytolaccae]
MSTYVRIGLGCLLYVGAFVLFSVGGYDRDWKPLALGLLGLVVATGLLQRGLERARKEGKALVRVLVPGVMIVGGLLTSAAWLFDWFGEPTGGVGLGGLCAFYLGVGQAVTEWRARPSQSLKRGKLWLAGVGATALAGLVVTIAFQAYGLLFTALAMLLLPIGITLLSEDLLWNELVKPWWALVGAGSIVAGAVCLLVLFDATPRLTLAIVGLAVVLMWFIASNTQADTLLVVGLIALFWVTYPTGEAPDDFRGPEAAKPALVALGDSYMSGEGAPEFYVRTSDPAKNNECRRAPTAYAAKVVREGLIGIDHLAFHACSGAVADEIHEKVKFKGDPVDDDWTAGLDQLDQLRDVLDETNAQVRYVLVSIGGNDAGFSDIGTACVAPGSCVARGQKWLDHLTKGDENVRSEVRAAFRAIRGVIGSEAPVVVVPYPNPIAPERCGYSVLREEEHKFVNAFVGELNGVIRTVAREERFYVVEPMENAFVPGSKRICDTDELDDSGMNFIALGSVRGVLDQASKPNKWIHNSFHPNERGHEAMAEVLAQWVGSHSRLPANPVGADVPSAFSAKTMADIVGPDVAYCGGADEPRYCGRSDRDWAITQIGGFLIKVGIPALAVVLGAWLLVMPALARWRGRS